jgi:hypothetical protein
MVIYTGCWHRRLKKKESPSPVHIAQSYLSSSSPSSNTTSSVA